MGDPTLDRADLKCDRCKKNSALGLHSCPYQSDVNDNDNTEYCDCCLECQRDCRDDI